MKIYNRSRHFPLLVCTVFMLMLIFILTLTSCKDKTQGDSTGKIEAASSSSASETAEVSTTSKTTAKSSLTEDNSAISQIPFGIAASWGPIKIFKGYVEDLYIKNNTGIGSVSYDIGSSTEGTYIYAVNVLDGELIGDVKISGRLYAVDICERYAFIWVKDSINIYDLNNKFELVETIADKSVKNEWISNFGNYFFVEDRQASDYLIDKRTLKKVNLKDIDLNISQDDQIYDLLYPDCLIGDPAAFTGAKSGNPVVYSLKNEKILGYIPSKYLSKIFAWDPENNLIFCRDAGRIIIYDLAKEKISAELNFTKSEAGSISSSANKNPKYYFGGGDRLHVMREFLPSKNGFYFLNGSESSYAIDFLGEIKYQLKKSDIIGEFEGSAFYEKDDSLGMIGDDFSTLWLNQKPEEPYHGVGPNFSKDSIVWLSDSSGAKDHGDGIYQWSYETGSYLNYTEFTGYEVVILSSQPLILAMRSQEGGVNAGWRLICYNPLKLPFNFIPDISIGYSPEKIYSGSSTVKFVCTIKNLPEQFGSQSISYEWDFGDGEKGSGKEVGHIYKKSGNYQASVTVNLGGSSDSATRSEEITVLEAPDINLLATPEFYSEVGLQYRLECKSGNSGIIGYVEWDFGDGSKGNGMMVSHTYKTGSYTATATIYNYDKTVSWKKEISVNSKFPEFVASASSLEGFSALKVDFDCTMVDSNFTDSGLKYQWTTDSEVLSEKNSFEKVFVYPGMHIVNLKITDPASTIVKEQSFVISVHSIDFVFTDEGRKIESNTSMFINTEYDVDKDGINQGWEDKAMISVNPYFEFDEEEDLLDNLDTDKVKNFVRITTYPSVEDPKYILFYYCVAFTRDYGRFANIEPLFEAHNGDVESVIMAWEVIDDKNLELKWVYTSSHGSADTSHSAVWDAVGESSNKGKVKFGFDETMHATLEFVDNRLKLQISEDKHAIYPTEKCGDDVTLVFNLIGEDCGGGGVYMLQCYNAGEPDAYLMDDIGNIFANERIWSGNIKNVGKFFGGRSESDNSPNSIGRNLTGLPAVLQNKIDEALKKE